MDLKDRKSSARALFAALGVVCGLGYTQPALADDPVADAPARPPALPESSMEWRALPGSLALHGPWGRRSPASPSRCNPPFTPIAPSRSPHH